MPVLAHGGCHAVGNMGKIVCNKYSFCRNIYRRLHVIYRRLDERMNQLVGGEEKLEVMGASGALKGN